MGERKLIHHRCLAVQLLKKESLVSSPVSSDSSSGDTATPVNDLATTATTPALQDGLHLFRVRQLLCSDFQSNFLTVNETGQR